MRNFTGVFEITLSKAVLLTTFALLHVLPAQAIPCSSRVPGEGLGGSLNCLNGAPGDATLGADADYAFDLNAGAFFGFDDWSFLQLGSPKLNLDQTSVDLGLMITTTGNAALGSWSLSPKAAGFDSLAVILKSDVAGESNVFWSAYLLRDQVTSGSWFSGTPLASFSVYGRASHVSIPEPASACLLFGALAALELGTVCRRYGFTSPWLWLCRYPARP